MGRRWGSMEMLANVIGLHCSQVHLGNTVPLYAGLGSWSQLRAGASYFPVVLDLAPSVGFHFQLPFSWRQEQGAEALSLPYAAGFRHSPAVLLLCRLLPNLPCDPRD